MFRNKIKFIEQEKIISITIQCMNCQKLMQVVKEYWINGIEFTCMGCGKKRFKRL